MSKKLPTLNELHVLIMKLIEKFQITLIVFILASMICFHYINIFWVNYSPTILCL